MNMETEFKQWLTKQDVKFLNDNHTGKIFDIFMAKFKLDHYSDIALLINNEERERRKNTLTPTLQKKYDSLWNK